MPFGGRRAIELRRPNARRIASGMTVTLRGDHVVLAPLTEAHLDGLVAAATRDRSTYAWTYVPDSREAMTLWMATAHADAAAGRAVPFATTRPDGEVIGTTRFGNIERWAWPLPLAHRNRTDGTPDAVEIGWTWLRGDVQRTAVNTEAKLLMLRHAFEAWRVERVAVRTDRRNARSRAAIERLGATLDGVIRAHMPAADGTIRDTASYAIVRSEWPRVRAGLEAKLAGYSPPTNA
jgi:RimJ/RimL family protein N-acetyltransferase